ncbi:MAG: hypothetical protein K6U03_00785 [Firmicutes bacterium]|nr:hypothetical protein [Bacillota bacterium]
MNRYRILLPFMFIIISINNVVTMKDINKNKKHKVYQVKAIEFYTPNTNSDSDWQNPNNIVPWDIPIIGKEPNKPFKLKIKIKFSPSVEKIDDLKLPIKVAISPFWGNFNWKTITINEKNARLSENKNELYLTISESELGEIQHISLIEDNLQEFCSFDAINSTNYNDSNMFDSLCQGIQKISARDVGNWSDKPKILYLNYIDKGPIPPWSAKANLAYLRTPGAVFVVVSTGKKIESHMIQSPVDWFYISAHGHLISGNILIGDGIEVGYNDVDWKNKDIDVIFFALCSILSIDPETGRGSGKYWAKTGPRCLLGYNFTAPPDNYLGDTFFTAKIVEMFFKIYTKKYKEEKYVGIAKAWGEANKVFHHQTDYVYNSCAITVLDEIQALYWYWEEDQYGSKKWVLLHVGI